MYYAGNMTEARRQAVRGSTLHTVGTVFDAWQWERDLPPDAEKQARQLFALANENRHREETYRDCPIDPDFVIGNLKWRHAQQSPSSPWAGLSNTPCPCR